MLYLLRYDDELLHKLLGLIWVGAKNCRRGSSQVAGFETADLDNNKLDTINLCINYLCYIILYDYILSHFQELHMILLQVDIHLKKNFYQGLFSVPNLLNKDTDVCNMMSGKTLHYIVLILSKMLFYQFTS